MLIARLIADPATLETRLDAASAQVRDAGMAIAMARMMGHESDVLQLSLPEGDPGGLRAILEEHFAPSDMLITAQEPVIPRLFVSDMDSTMIGQECVDELAGYAGIKEKIAAITERAMQGELDFESALRERVGLLEGLGENAIEECLKDQISATPGAKTLVATLRSKGCRTVLVTGGFHHFADPIADQLGFERVVGNTLEVAGGKLTGKLLGDITDGATKESVLRDEMSQLGDGAASLATGDGANDIPMLQASDYGFAYRGKPAARDAAKGRIDRGDLTSILLLLDIPKSDWVTT